jgi:2'-5' RNA ligase
MSIVRCFIAIELEAPARAEVSRLERQLRAEVPGSQHQVSWVAEENVHLTLVFLGAVEMARLDPLPLELERRFKAWRPFEVATTRPGTFPERGPPKVLWLGVADPGPDLLEVQQATAAACRALELGEEGRTFHAHLTAGRVRERSGANELASAWRNLASQSQRQRVAGVSLMSSETRPAGARYTRLQFIPLGKAPLP